MKNSFDVALSFTLLPENDGQPCHCTPGDAGSWTSYGVTRATWSRWIGKAASVADMQALTVKAVTGLYQAWYWNTVEGDLLPAGIDLFIFDNGVLSGEATSAMQLQNVVGTVPDGHIGPKTLAAVAAEDPGLLIVKLRTAQEAHYRSLEKFPLFGRGWIARLNRRATAALAMIPKS